MKKWLLALLLLSPTAVIAVTTTTVTQSLFEPIKKKVRKQLQAKVNKWKEKRKTKKDSSES